MFIVGTTTKTHILKTTIGNYKQSMPKRLKNNGMPYLHLSITAR